MRFVKCTFVAAVFMGLLVSVARVAAQSKDGAVQEEHRRPVILDRPGDPYMPAGPRMSPTAPRAPAGSVQVNVNAMGMNIVGDAANEPSIAIDPNDPDRMSIGWRQFDTIASNFRQAGRAYTSDGGQTWTFPGVINPGVFRSDPVLGADAFGRFFYNSLKGDFCIDVFVSTNGGVTWPVSAPAFGGDKAWMDVDQRSYGAGAGHLYQAWSFAATCEGGGLFARSIDHGASWQPPVTLPSPSVFGTVAVGPDGELYVGGVDFPSFSNSNFVVLRSDDAKNPAVTPSFQVMATGNILGGALLGGGGPNPDGLLGQVWIAVNKTGGPNRGHVYMLSSVDPPGGDPLDIRFSRSTDGGQTWSPSVRVNDDSTSNGAWQWFGTMSVAPNGRIDAVWNDTRDDPNNLLSRTYYAYSTDEGVTWTTNTAMTPAWDSMVGFPNQNKIGDYYDMESDLFGAHLAYAATFNGEQDVYYMRILVEDCNTNGVSDAQEIADETSDDCNSNGVPDECEPDCNDNGVADACDIASLVSLDCNTNGIPDECEVGGASDCNSNGTSDLCDIFAQTSGDCNLNNVPDECDVPPIGSMDDCNSNLVPDVCEPNEDCNENGVTDICDIAEETSEDCDADGIPDECQLDGTHVLMAEGFEGPSLPAGWTATGLWHVTSACPRPNDPCNPVKWAYYGIDASCNFNTGAANSGVLTAPSFVIPSNVEQVTLTYCYAYGGQGGNANVSGLDWAWAAVNGVEVDDPGDDDTENDWTPRTVDLTAFAGQTVTLSFHFDSRSAFLNTFLGFMVDDVRVEAVVTGSLDCNDNIIPDACEIAAEPPLDCDENGVLDECEGPVTCACMGLLGDTTGEGDRNGADVQTFVDCQLLGVPETPTCGCADMDQNGLIDAVDAELFVTCLLGIACPN